MPSFRWPLVPYKTNLKYGFIEMNGDNETVSKWTEKPEVSGLINIGCYVMEPAFLKLIPRSAAIRDGRCS